MGLILWGILCVNFGVKIKGGNTPLYYIQLTTIINNKIKTTNKNLIFADNIRTLYLNKFLDDIIPNIDIIKNTTINNIIINPNLLELFENYKTIFLESGNNKFNKNIILLSIREMTNLSTKEIRNAMKKFKKLYVVVQTKVNI